MVTSTTPSHRLLRLLVFPMHAVSDGFAARLVLLPACAGPLYLFRHLLLPAQVHPRTPWHRGNHGLHSPFACHGMSLGLRHLGEDVTHPSVHSDAMPTVMFTVRARRGSDHFDNFFTSRSSLFSHDTTFVVLSMITSKVT